MEIVESDRHVSTVSIAQELNIAQKIVWNHLNKAGYKKKLNVWVPHELTQKNLMDRIFICELLLNRNKIDPFLKRIVVMKSGSLTTTSSENGRGRIAVSRRKRWPSQDWWPGRFCCVFDWQGIIYYELLPYGQTLNSDLYCQQLDNYEGSNRPEAASVG